jgi:hypothetical protein
MPILDSVFCQGRSCSAAGIGEGQPTGLSSRLSV